MTEKNGIPKLRFPGFSGAWEQRKLGEITDSYSGGTPSVGVKEYYGGEIPFIRSAEINSDSTELFITQKGFDNSSARIANIGDILYALYGATSGEVGRARLKGAVNQAILVIQPHTEYYSEFLMQWLRKSKQTIIDTYLQGGQGNLSGTIVKDLVIDCPSQEEQQQIGTFFRNLDNLITLHQRRLDHIKELKKGLLQKMFPKEGETVPEIRFPEFTNAWELRKLSDIADRFDNLRVPITASDRKSGDTPYYGANGIQDYVEGFTHDGEFILVAEDGANDLKNYPVQYVNGKVWVNNHAHVLQGKNTITDNKFLMNSIKNFNIEPFLVGGGRAKLNADVMMKLNILLPTFDEQEKIGSLFSLLDKTIALHQRKLDHLQQLKKALLQQMFV